MQYPQNGASLSRYLQSSGHKILVPGTVVFVCFNADPIIEQFFPIRRKAVEIGMVELVIIELSRLDYPLVNKLSDRVLHHVLSQERYVNCHHLLGAFDPEVSMPVSRFNACELQTADIVGYDRLSEPCYCSDTGEFLLDCTQIE